MSILDQFSGLVNQYSSDNPPADQASEHFQQVATQVPSNELGGMLTNIFRSPETGSFGDNVSQMYGQSNPQQQAGILNKLLHAAGGSGMLSHLGLNLPGAGATVTPEQARQVSPTAVKEIADQAERHNPTIVDQAGEFYAQHPQLVQALGTGVAIWAMQRFLKR